MSSWVERGPEGIIYKAAQKRDIPNLDLLTVLFETKYASAVDETVLHVDAEDPTKAITKADLRTLLKRTAYSLRSRYGIGKNGPDTDNLLVISTGHWMLPNLCYATIAAGGIFSASSPATTPQELAGQYQQVGATLLVCNSELRVVALAAAKILSLPADRLLVLGDGPSFTLQQASSGKVISLSTQALEWERVTDHSVLANRTICILFSSGTTGLPKGVRLSHRNLIAEAVMTIDANKEYYARAQTGFVYRTLAHLPAAHIAGIQGYLVNPQYYGGTVYWMRRFDFGKFLEYNKKYKITFFFSVPPVFMAIARHPAVKDQFESLDSAVCGAAPMSKELQAAVRRKLGKTAVSQTWGLSETTGSMTVCPRSQTPDVEGSVSMLVPNGEARIVDDEGRDVEVGACGEIWVRGPTVMKGYWKNDGADREAFVDGGWFRTGDVGYFKDGLFFIVDRKKELIKYKGMQVAPAELEGILLTHPKIQDAAVIGVQGDGTEVPRAYVVADTKDISAAAIESWVKDHVANHKYLRGGVVFIPAIPKSPAGKILRKQLRALAEQEAKARL